MSNLRKLMESIDDIYTEAEEAQPEVTAADMMKDIVGSLRLISGKIADSTEQEQALIKQDLQKVVDVLAELSENFDDEAEKELDSTEDFSDNDFTSSEEEDEQDEDEFNGM